MTGRLRDGARRIKRDVHALYLASRDPRVPWHAKLLAIAVDAGAPGQSRRGGRHRRDLGAARGLAGWLAVAWIL